MQNSNPGFSTDRVLATGVDLVAAGYDTTRIKSFEKMLLDYLQGIAGIESAAFTRVTPISYKSYSSDRITVEGFETQSGREPVIEYDEIGTGFLAAMAFHSSRAGSSLQSITNRLTRLPRLTKPCCANSGAMKIQSANDFS